MDISAFKRDTASIEAGQWIEDIPGMGSLRLKVRGMSSKFYVSTFSRLARNVPKADRQRDGSLNIETSVRLMGEALHETVLLDWDGLTDGDKPFPYDGETALKWLTEPEFRSFADAVVWSAGIVDNGRAEVKDDLSKNSQEPSGGTSNGPAPTKSTIA